VRFTHYDQPLYRVVDSALEPVIGPAADLERSPDLNWDCAHLDSESGHVRSVDFAK